MHQLNSLHLYIDNYVFNDGSQQKLLKLQGTIPIQYRTKQYNMPIVLWIPPNFPNSCPICYVTPVRGMVIKQKHMHCDSQGLIYHPYLHYWKAGDSTLVELIGLLCSIFGKDPPLYSSKARISSSSMQPSYSNMCAPKFKDDTIGLTFDGAKDVNNFRKCIAENIMPSVDSITCNGLFSEYYFDTKTSKHVMDDQKNDNVNDESLLFYPSYCFASCYDKQCNGFEHYMTVGLNSNIKQSEFQRKNLNLIILVDVSGSMCQTFNGDSNYKLDNVDLVEWRKTLKVDDRIGVKDGKCWYPANIVEINEQHKNQIKIHFVGYDVKYDECICTDSSRLMPLQYVATKLTSTKSAINAMLKQLTVKDRLGIVTFNNKADIIQKLEFINDINMTKLEKQISDIAAKGGTNFEAGYSKSIELYAELFGHEEYKLNSMYEDYENRIMILTDAVLNRGMTDSNLLLNMIDSFATNNWGNNESMINYIYTTFIAVGMDANMSLIEKISKTRGCNYYSVRSTKEFHDKMNEEFRFMVNPLAFDVCFTLKSEANSCEIEKVYGASTQQENDIINDGEIIRIHTLFPSKRSDKNGKTKGGIQLIKLKNNDSDGHNINVQLVVTFEDRYGKKYKNMQQVSFDARKQYTELIGNDMIESDEKEADEITRNFYDNTGIRKAVLLCKYVGMMRNWIKKDGIPTMAGYSNLIISDGSKKMFIDFIEFFKNEMMNCNDDSLQQELDIIEKLINLKCDN